MGKSYFEFKDKSSAKFWEINQTGKKVTIRFGKIGVAGQTTIKYFDSPAEAKTHADKVKAEKKKKGYTEQLAAAPSPSTKPRNTQKNSVSKGVAGKPAKKSKQETRYDPAPQDRDSDANVFYMKNGQELLDALESVLGWADQWEDLFKWIAMGKNTDYDEDELISPVKTSWCQLKKYKDLWGIEVISGGRSRSGAGWFGDDLEIKSFELVWKWCDGKGKWRGPNEKGGLTNDRDKAHKKFREWVGKDPIISEGLEDKGERII